MYLGDQDRTTAPRHSTAMMCIHCFKSTSAPFTALNSETAALMTPSTAGSNFLTFDARYTGPMSRRCSRYRLASNSESKSRVSGKCGLNRQSRTGLFKAVAPITAGQSKGGSGNGSPSDLQ
jgi:hypothetical protein